jgi:hypothetical protein
LLLSLVDLKAARTKDALLSEHEHEMLYLTAE